jgi:hypothetical protein
MGACRAGPLGLPAMRPGGSALSSAILYAAIVAIWACVLVPRWLRQRSAPSRQAEPVGDLSAAPELDERPAEPLTEAADASAADSPAPTSAQPAAAEQAEAQPAAAQAGVAQPAPAQPSAAQAGVAQPAPAQPSAAQLAVAKPGPAQPAAAQLSRAQPAAAQPGPAQPGPARSRAESSFIAEPAAPPASYALAVTTHTGSHVQLLRARRRLLATLVLITAAAAGLSALHLAPRWLAIPPVLMLAGFIVLLRDAAHSDAERSRRRALAARVGSHAVASQEADGRAQLAKPGSTPLAAQAQPVQVPDVTLPPLPAVSAEPQEWNAQVIDISARRGDQLYDQYADAAERAVGD